MRNGEEIAPLVLHYPRQLTCLRYALPFFWSHAKVQKPLSNDDCVRNLHVLVHRVSDLLHDEIAKILKPTRLRWYPS